MADLANLEQQYVDYITKLKANGRRLLSYKVPCCGATLESMAPPKNERWDTLATCPECGELYMKLSTSKKITAKLVEI